MDEVTIPASEEEHPEIRLLSPGEVFSLIERLPNPINIAVLLAAATGVRISECLGLRWRHVLWDENRISIEQVFRSAVSLLPEPKQTLGAVVKKMCREGFQTGFLAGVIRETCLREQ